MPWRSYLISRPEWHVAPSSLAYLATARGQSKGDDNGQKSELVSPPWVRVLVTRLLISGRSVWDWSDRRPSHPVGSVPPAPLRVIVAGSNTDPGAENDGMLAHLVDTLTHLSYGQSIGFAAAIATLVMLVFGCWDLGT